MCPVKRRNQKQATRKSRHSMAEEGPTMSKLLSIPVGSSLHKQLSLGLRRFPMSWFVFLLQSQTTAHLTSQHFVKNMFSVSGAYKPEHLFYNTNCDAKQQVMKSSDPFFANMGMCVDVWHFLNKHKATHDFHQEHRNPADYPELKGPDGKWFFNSSVAEQTNVWLGGYHSICHEMLPVKYNFFLDEMICLWNQQIVAKLAADGHHPRHAPHPSEQ